MLFSGNELENTINEYNLVNMFAISKKAINTVSGILV